MVPVFVGSLPMVNTREERMHDHGGRSLRYRNGKEMCLPCYMVVLFGRIKTERDCHSVFSSTLCTYVSLHYG